MDKKIQKKVVKIQLDNNENKKAQDMIKNIIISIKNETEKLESIATENSVNQITALAGRIKFAQEKYASTLSKHESIKTETIKTSK